MNPSTITEKSTTNTQDHVFEQLLEELVSGRYQAGSRLPAERELAAQLGASRSTLREALRRLAEWRLIESRRGSGIVVLPQSVWTIDVLPAYMRLVSQQDLTQMVQLVTDLLYVRRAFYVDFIRVVASRPQTQQTDLTPVREQVQHAWSLREDMAQFVTQDFEVLRALAEHVGFLPALWMLNSFAQVYHQIAALITQVNTVPEDYLETYDGVLNAMAEANADEAARIMAKYLDTHDNQLFDLLGFLL